MSDTYIIADDQESVLEENASFSEEGEVDEFSEEFIEDLIDKILEFAHLLAGHPLHSYQTPFARRILRSVLINDGALITALAARQSGKSEILSNVVSALMVLLPRLAKIYPDLLGKFENGFWVGMFAPVEGQAETLFGRTVSRLSSDRAMEILGDPEIDDIAAKNPGVTRGVRLKNSGSILLMMTANPRAKIESKSFHMILIDECFPAETPVLTTEGWVPIGTIVNGGRRNWIVATQDGDGLGWARVRTGYRTPRHTDLVRVDHEYGSVYATANHPFMVDGEEVPAISLQVGSRLFVVPGSDQSGRLGTRQARRDSVLLQSVPGAVTESDGAGGRTTVAVLDAPEDWAPPQGAGRQWSGADRATAETLGRATRGMGGRACLPYWRASQGRPSDALQDRPGPSRVEDRRGDRRREPWALAADGRSAQGPVAIGSRVVGVEVLEPGSPEFDQFSDGADFVYTLEVDSESHTYVAGGVLVGNCQDADDLVVSKSISPMGAYYNATMVKTGTPTTHKNNFYKSIQINKRSQPAKVSRRNHFEWNWKDVIKVNPNYKKYIRKEMLQLGEDSDEFQMCVAPGTRVLTEDLRHIPARDVVVGMKLVGFDEERPDKGLHRRFRTSTVESVSHILRPCFRIELDDGTSVVSSSDHPWLVLTAGRRTIWKRTKDLVDTDRIFRIAHVWEEERSYEAAYLAGAFDGEGCLNRRPDGTISQVTFAQKPGLMMNQVQKYLSELGFEYWVSSRNEARNGVAQLGVAGGQANVLRFLGQVRPIRLLDKFSSDNLGSIGRHDHASKQWVHPRVTGLVDLGIQEVVGFQTSTRTFVAEGLASHNSYNCRWMLDRGMFISQSLFEELGDTSQQVVRGWNQSPVVVGIDPARKVDSTVVTVLWVNWDYPDEYGFYEHRVLNWLEIQGDDWEEQYYQIVNFLAPYDVLAVGVDGQGVGDAVASRLKLLLPRSEVITFISNQAEQSKRWKHLLALLQRRAIGWPAHAKTRRLKVYQRFMQQMLDAEKQFSGQHFSVSAPNENGAHDDFVDSLALAAYTTAEMYIPRVDESPAPWFD